MKLPIRASIFSAAALFCLENGPDECQFSFVMVREEAKAAADAAKRAAEQRRGSQQSRPTQPQATRPGTTPLRPNGFSIIR